jgi:hypothetical protein
MSISSSSSSGSGEALSPLQERLRAAAAAVRRLDATQEYAALLVRFGEAEAAAVPDCGSGMECSRSNV